MRAWTLLLALVLAPSLVACAQPQQQAAAIIAPAFEQTQTSIAEVLVPALVEARDIVQEALPPLSPVVPSSSSRVSPAAVDLIVRWEVTSAQVYTRKYQRPIWPGGASGVTIGIGYDLGHQTRSTIARDWAGHPQLEQLLAASGVVGDRAGPLAASMRAVVVPYAVAERVFTESTLPTYHGAARRALHLDAFDALPLNPQGANVSLGYNRGWSMKGERNREKREIRDTCVPAADAACIAQQLRAMCRIWAGTPNGKGLCARRNDEARLAVSS